MSETTVLHGAAAASAASPLLIDVLGYQVPVLAAGLSVCAVVLAGFIAPPPERKLSKGQHAALIVLLCILVLALALTDPSRDLMLSVCWSVGLGYSGLPVVQAIRDRMFPDPASPDPVAALNEPVLPPLPEFARFEDTPDA